MYNCGQGFGLAQIVQILRYGGCPSLPVPNNSTVCCNWNQRVTPFPVVQCAYSKMLMKQCKGAKVP